MPEEVKFLHHPSAEMLELYAMGKLTGGELDHVEEHLLLCTRCQEGVEEADAFIAATRKAAQQLPPASPKSAKGRRTLFSIPPPAVGGAVAALLLIVATLLWRPALATVQTVDLSALRGATVTAEAKSGTPLQLNLVLADASQSPAMTVEIVDSEGVPRWDRRDVPVEGTRLSARIDRSLRPGQYFVRVYPNPLKQTVLSEFSLLVR